MTDEIRQSADLLQHFSDRADRIDNENLRASLDKVFLQQKQWPRSRVLGALCSKAELRRVPCQQA